MLIKSQLGFPKRTSGFLFAKNQKKASVFYKKFILFRF